MRKAQHKGQARTRVGSLCRYAGQHGPDAGLCGRRTASGCRRPGGCACRRGGSDGGRSPPETPAEDAVPTETPAEDAVPTETPTEDAVSTETPAEESAAEETPAEEAPAKEAALAPMDAPVRGSCRRGDRCPRCAGGCCTSGYRGSHRNKCRCGSCRDRLGG